MQAVKLSDVVNAPSTDPSPDPRVTALIEENLPLVPYTLGKMHLFTGGGITFERADYWQIGYLGLVIAAKTYREGYPDGAESAKFSTWAVLKIRGSVIDALRKENWSGRSKTRSKGSKNSKELAELPQYTYPASLEAITSLFNAESGTRNADYGSIDAILGRNGHFTDPWGDVEAKIDVKTALEALSTRDRAIVILRTYYQHSYYAIAEVTGLSPTRCMQLYKRSLVRMRTVLENGKESVDMVPTYRENKMRR